MIFISHKFPKRKGLLPEVESDIKFVNPHAEQFCCQKAVAFIFGLILILAVLIANSLSNISQPQHRPIPANIKGNIVDVFSKKPVENADVCIRYYLGGLEGSGIELQRGGLSSCSGLLNKRGKGTVGIYFDANKWDIKPSSRPALQEIAALLKQQPQFSLHCNVFAFLNRR